MNSKGCEIASLSSLETIVSVADTTNQLRSELSNLCLGGVRTLSDTTSLKVRA